MLQAKMCKCVKVVENYVQRDVLFSVKQEQTVLVGSLFKVIGCPCILKDDFKSVQHSLSTPMFVSLT